MFGWRKKKTEDFEWHKYVRTTIKIKREHRREQVAQAKISAARGARSAVSSALRTSRSALLKTWQLICSGSRRFASASARLAQIVLSRLWRGLKSSGSHGSSLLSMLWAFIAKWTARLTAALVAFLERPAIRAPLGWIGCLAALAGLWQWTGHGFGTQSRFALSIAAAALALAYAPALLAAMSRWLTAREFAAVSRFSAAGRNMKDRLDARRPAGLPRLVLPTGTLHGLTAGVLAAAVLWLGWLGFRAMPPLAPTVSRLAAQLPLMKSPEPPIKGRAHALSGNLLRISGKTVKLHGIAAPEALQRCKKGRRSWRCGRAAKKALARLLRRKRLRCNPSGKDERGYVIATCFIGKKDIAAILVRRGHVFAAKGFLTAYAREEALARKDRTGLWQGNALRPADYRARIWEQAKRRSPDGCPIKGNVTRAGKIYVLPWARNYKHVRIRSARGERWFCSESAARAAGWRQRGRS